MRYLFFSLALVLAFTSSRAQNPVTITGAIKGLQAGTWVYCYAFNDSHQSDSVQAQDGRFAITVVVPAGGADQYLIQIGKQRAEHAFMFVYLDKGNVHIQGPGPLLQNTTVAGGPAIADYNAFADFKKQHATYAAKDSLGAKARALLLQKDTVQHAAVARQYEQADSINSLLTRQWILDHKSSPVSVLLLTTELRRLNLDSQAVIFDQLTAAAKDNAPATRLARSIRINALTGIGKTAPDFTQPDTAGKPVSLHDFRGQYVLVDFWASWCVPCRAENPHVVAAFQKYHNKHFTVLGISLDRTASKGAWLKAIQHDGLTWTHVSDLKAWQNEVALLYDIRAIPSNLLIGPNGVVIARNLRGEVLEKKLHELLD